MEVSPCPKNVDANLLPDPACMDFLCSQSYLRNDPPLHILQDHHFQLPLHTFICYCIGMYQDEKSVQCIQILQKTTSPKFNNFLVKWFHPDDPHQHVTFWVNSGASLKKHFFLFTDKINFFRSTFIHYPEMDKYFRLSSLMDFFKIPESTPLQEKIYHTPIKFHLFKPLPTSSSDKKKNTSKREQGLKRTILKIFRQDVDHYLQRKYPSLFQELLKITPL